MQMGQTLDPGLNECCGLNGAISATSAPMIMHCSPRVPGSTFAFIKQQLWYLPCPFNHHVCIP